MRDFIQISKDSHASEFKSSYWAGAFDEKVVDTRRHHVLLNEGYTLISHLEPTRLLTIGDGLARDAGFFKKKFPSTYCIASDLTCQSLQEAVLNQNIDEACDIDVESIPYPDNSIDIVIAKEAFHHWPRPMLGLYEMLRVATQAVLLIEPNDVFTLSNANTIVSPEHFCDHYEKVGNYKYNISPREIIKAAWALYYPACAAKGFNDPYKTPFDFDEWLVEKEKLDCLGRDGNRQYNLYAIAIYKKPFSHDKVFSDSRIKTYIRPLNPHLPEDSL